MQNFGRVLSVFVFIILLSSCNGGTTQVSEEKPEPSQSSNFAMNPVKSEKGTYLSIKTDLLGKEFLLQGSFSEQKSFGYPVGNPTTSGMKSRIVIFQEDGDYLLLTESSQGIHPGNEMPTNILITKFPIKERKDDLIIFDFNVGMTDAAISWDWYVSDYSGNVIEPDLMLDVRKSYIRDTKTFPEAISVIQNITTKFSDASLPIEIVYYFTLYKQNPSFKPIHSHGFDYLGYFEANPIVEDESGIPVTYITKWDISKPVTYYISTVVPEEYRDIVKEGVIYWNKVFGQDVLRVEMAPEGMTAPDFEHNIIQWHSNYTTGAYADAQVDPRTGEILHVQIYVSNSFTELFKLYSLPRLDRTLEEDILPSLHLRGDQLCNLRVDDMVSSLYKNRDIIENLPEERVDGITKDFLRSVVAHEVGHTLGLRHNFAASSVNNLSSEENKKILVKYFKESKLPDNIDQFLNSVMDYPDTLNDSIIGAIINKGDLKGLKYDKYAIEWAYLKTDQKLEYTGEPYCPDSRVGYFEDCQRWDAGRHIIERQSYETNDSFREIPRLISEAYLRSKTHPIVSFRRSLKRSLPSATYIASSVTTPLEYLLSQYTKDINLLSIYVKHPGATDVDKEIISGETLDWLNKETSFAGGIKKIFELISPEIYTKTLEIFPARFDGIIASDSFKNAPLPEGGTVSFTDDDVTYMKTRVRELFGELDEKLASAITTTLKGETKLQELESEKKDARSQTFKLIDEIESLEWVFARWAGFVIAAVGSNELEFRYSLDTRKNAVDLLKSGGPFPDWMEKYIPSIAETLRQQLEKVFGKSIEEVKAEDFPRNQRQRVLDEMKLYHSIAPKENHPSQS